MIQFLMGVLVIVVILYIFMMIYQYIFKPYITGKAEERKKQLELLRQKTLQIQSRYKKPIQYTYQLSDDKRDLLEKMKDKMDKQYDPVFNKILRDGGYNFGDRNFLNKIRTEYIKLLKKNKISPTKPSSQNQLDNYNKRT